MSTYRNPTEIINRDLGNIIINTVNKVTENHLNSVGSQSRVPSWWNSYFKQKVI